MEGEWFTKLAEQENVNCRNQFRNRVTEGEQFTKLAEQENTFTVRIH